MRVGPLSQKDQKTIRSAAAIFNLTTTEAVTRRYSYGCKTRLKKWSETHFSPSTQITLAIMIAGLVSSIVLPLVLRSTMYDSMMPAHLPLIWLLIILTALDSPSIKNELYGPETKVRVSFEQHNPPKVEIKNVKTQDHGKVLVNGNFIPREHLSLPRYIHTGDSVQEISSFVKTILQKDLIRDESGNVLLSNLTEGEEHQSIEEQIQKTLAINSSHSSPSSTQHHPLNLFYHIWDSTTAGQVESERPETIRQFVRNLELARSEIDQIDPRVIESRERAFLNLFTRQVAAHLPAFKKVAQ